VLLGVEVRVGRGRGSDEEVQDGSSSRKSSTHTKQDRGVRCDRVGEGCLWLAKKDCYFACEHGKFALA